MVNPLRSRRFAEAIGQRAKNDRVDPPCWPASASSTTPPQPRNLLLLSDLLVLRCKLVEQLSTLRNLCAELGPEAAGGASTTCKALHADIEDCDRRMRACIVADAELRRRDAIVQSVPGCGPVNAACLCAAMPELGRLGRRKAAALFGLAPFDRDCGQHWGGRAQPRHLLHMAALTAGR